MPDKAAKIKVNDAYMTPKVEVPRLSRRYIGMPATGLAFLLAVLYPFKFDLRSIGQAFNLARNFSRRRLGQPDHRVL